MAAHLSVQAVAPGRTPGKEKLCFTESNMFGFFFFFVRICFLFYIFAGDMKPRTALDRFYLDVFIQPRFDCGQFEGDLHPTYCSYFVVFGQSGQHHQSK